MAEEKRFDMILGKQRARARLRDFIGKRLHSYRNGRVLCLPGEHGREIEHVYRKLGFQDRNIVGLEADAGAFQGVREHYPKITSHNETIDDYLSRVISIGVKLEWPPRKTAVQVAFVGAKRGQGGEARDGR